MNFADRFIPAFRRTFKARESGAGASRYQEILAGLTDVIKVNSGEPDLTAAPVAVEAAVEALRGGRTRYVFHGLPQLRDVLARKLDLENHVRIVDSRTQILITNGSAEAMSVLFETLLEPHDEVLTTDPYYGGHVGAIRNARGIPVLVPTTGDRLWEPDPADVESRITPRTKAFIFANPGNPTAAVYRKETLEALLEIAHRRNILLIPDELFERYVYDGRSHVSTASLPGADDRVITLGGFSKSYCMTGWRLGWVVAPPWLADPLEQVRYATSMAAATPNQWGAIAALSDAAQPYYAEVYRTYGERRRFFLDAMTEVGLTQNPTPGAFLGMLDIRTTGRSTAEVAERFLSEARVAMYPGNTADQHAEGWVRYSLVQPIDRLKEMVDRLAPVIRGLLADNPSGGRRQSRRV